MGGEPTLRMDVLLASQKIFPFCSVVTNGIIKIPDTWKHDITVSLDGFKDQTDRIRGEGVFDMVVNNYKEDKRIICTFTITKNNMEQIPDFTDYVKNFLKWKGIEFTICREQYDILDKVDTNKRFIKEPIQDEDNERLRSIFYKIIEKYPTFVNLAPEMLDNVIRADHSSFCRVRKNFYFLDNYGNRQMCYTVPVDCKHCMCTPDAGFNFRSNLKLLKLSFTAKNHMVRMGAIVHL